MQQLRIDLDGSIVEDGLSIQGLSLLVLHGWFRWFGVLVIGTKQFQQQLVQLVTVNSYR
jgi:hypothetical protein